MSKVFVIWLHKTQDRHNSTAALSGRKWKTNIVLVLYIIRYTIHTKQIYPLPLIYDLKVGWLISLCGVVSVKPDVLSPSEESTCGPSLQVSLALLPESNDGLFKTHW